MSLLFLCLFFILDVNGDEYNHIYVENEEVELWMNTVGPYHNRRETYAYFSLSFCAGPRKPINHYCRTFMEVLQGLDIKSSGLDINFKVDVISTPYCEVTLTNEEQKALIHAVKNHYWYQMYLDELPVWGFVGEMEETVNGTNYNIWTHKKFEIGYNGKQIVDVNLTSENKVDPVEVEMIQFTYEVIWKKSTIKFEDRIAKYSDPDIRQFRLPWVNFVITLVIVLFWTVLLSMILKQLLCKDHQLNKREELTNDIDNQNSAILK